MSFCGVWNANAWACANERVAIGLRYERAAVNEAQREGQLKLLGVEINYADRGPIDGAPLLLIMGLGMQRVAWPDSLLDALVERGFRCITFDNRDVGLSTRYEAYGVPPTLISMAARLLRRRLRLPYALSDIADDASGLLTHLGISQAHVLGISMGGMIAQHFAHRHPAQTLSLTLMCTSSGRLGLPTPSAAVMRQLLKRPVGKQVTIDAAVRYVIDLFRIIGSPAYPVDAADLERHSRATAMRASSGNGVGRQLAAILNDGDRSELLRHLNVPTLILHGNADPMVPVTHGIDLARKVPRARLERIDGWGHDLPNALSGKLAGLIADHAACPAAQSSNQR